MPGTMKPNQNKKAYQYVLMVIGLVSLLVCISPASAQTPSPEKPVTIYLFYGEGCPHCASARQFFESILPQYPQVEYKEYEVYYNADNQALFVDLCAQYGIEQLGVPTFFIGPYYMQGYNEDYNQEIQNLIEKCLREGCTDALAGVEGQGAVTQITPTTSLQSTATPQPGLAPPSVMSEATQTPETIHRSSTLNVPLIGEVDLGAQSLALSTILIASVDGFNPCSMWVLTMLLALTIHTGSRRKVLLIGLVFLAVSALIYAVIIAGLFSVLKVVSFLGWVRVVVAMVSLFFAIVNIKDYFWYKEGISFTIAEDKKPGIYQRLRAVMDASQSFWGLLGATVLLSVGVSMVEFSCTAGFPVLWSNLLTAHTVSTTTFLLLLLLYMLVYQVVLFIVFISVVTSLKASRLDERHGRLLKLVGGMLMLVLALVMLIDPGLMDNLANSLLIFGLAFLATIIILVIHQKVLPKYGVHIGSQPGGKEKP